MGAGESEGGALELAGNRDGGTRDWRPVFTTHLSPLPTGFMEELEDQRTSGDNAGTTREE